MCAILDANVVHEVFGEDRPSAGERFRRWISAGEGRLVVGGKLTEELRKSGKFEVWFAETARLRRAKLINENRIDREVERLKSEGSCRSNDQHVIALARLSGARLLYSDDEDLRDDFRDLKLLSKPRGKLYPKRDPERLLRQKNLCRGRI